MIAFLPPSMKVVALPGVGGLTVVSMQAWRQALGTMCVLREKKVLSSTHRLHDQPSY
jgi:hypothetical protein